VSAWDGPEVEAAPAEPRYAGFWIRVVANLLWGRTIGGRVFGLRLVRVDAQPVTWGTCIIRYIGLFISAIALAIGLIWVAFDRRKQGWMDKMAGTYVIRDI
jgi:uncharacterized RDD family membrane protein YckC